MVEERFTGILVAGNVSELVAYNEVVVYEFVFKRAERAFLAGFFDLRYQPWHGGEYDGHAVCSGFDSQRCGYVCLACTGIAEQDYVSPLPDKVERLQQWQCGSRVLGKFVDKEVAQIFELREVGSFY